MHAAPGSPVPLPRTRKRPEEPVRSGNGSACAGRSDHRGQGVRRLLARTADRAPATAGTAHQTLYISTSADCAPRSVQRSLPIPGLSRRSFTVSVETAGLVFDLAGPSGQDEIYGPGPLADSGLSTTFARRRAVFGVCPRPAHTGSGLSPDAAIALERMFSVPGKRTDELRAARTGRRAVPGRRWTAATAPRQPRARLRGPD
jgi:hypothetical protein